MRAARDEVSAATAALAPSLATLHSELAAARALRADVRRCLLSLCRCLCRVIRRSGHWSSPAITIFYPSLSPLGLFIIVVLRIRLTHVVGQLERVAADVAALQARGATKADLGHLRHDVALALVRAGGAPSDLA
jgi:hypothetical protein